MPSRSLIAARRRAMAQIRKDGAVHLRYVCSLGHADPARETVSPDTINVTATTFAAEIDPMHQCSVCLRFVEKVESWTKDGETLICTMNITRKPTEKE